MKSILFTLGVALLLFSCESQKEKLINKWKASEIDLAGNVLSGELINDVFIAFNKDGSYQSNILGEDESDAKGTWVLDGNIIVRKSASNKEWKLSIESLSSDMLVLTYEDHGMKRKLSFIISK